MLSATKNRVNKLDLHGTAGNDREGFLVPAQQRHLYRLKPEPLQELDAWLAPFRRFWSAHVDALERHLDQVDQITPTKRKTRRRR